MASRSSWEGYLRLNLISVPVKAYTATVAGKGRIGFHLLHAKCSSRIRYKKVCPLHGEVPNEEIVSGYEHAKGEYVTVDKGELAKLRPDADKAIDIDVFVSPPQLDPAYFTERTYYLVPDGRVAARSYAVLQRVMADESRYAVATMVFSGKEQVVCVWPAERVLAVTFLSYAEGVKAPGTFSDQIPDVEVPAKELQLARGLVEASTAERFDLAAYKDEYGGKVLKLLESRSRVKGRRRAAADEAPAVINLMEALKQSLKQAGRGGRAGRGNAARRKTG